MNSALPLYGCECPTCKSPTLGVDPITEVIQCYNSAGCPFRDPELVDRRQHLLLGCDVGLSVEEARKLNQSCAIWEHDRAMKTEVGI